VIDRESYENPVIARLSMKFLAVKVDRRRAAGCGMHGYQSAISAISARVAGRWTGFLMPMGKTVFGGRIFHGGSVWGGRISARAAGSGGVVQEQESGFIAGGGIAGGFVRRRKCSRARTESSMRKWWSRRCGLTQLFDIRMADWKAPKFPHCSAIDLVLERYQQTKERHLLAVGGKRRWRKWRARVYDQLAGGFHRYSVDEKWLVPHFEKMSYGTIRNC